MTVTIGRRELLAALGGAATAWPLAARCGTGGPGPRCDRGHWHGGDSHLAAGHHGEAVMTRQAFNRSNGTAMNLSAVRVNGGRRRFHGR
jgi:hypothetical protein